MVFRRISFFFFFLFYFLYCSVYKCFNWMNYTPQSEVLFPGPVLMKNHNWSQLCIRLDLLSDEIKLISWVCAVTNSTTNKHQTAGISHHCISDDAASDSYNSIKEQMFIYVLAANPLFPLCVCRVYVCGCTCCIVGESTYSSVTVHF